MRDSKLYWGMLLAALSGFVCVAIGAFGAHGISDARARELIATGAHYQAWHALAVFAAYGAWRWGAARALWAVPLFLAGTALFSGSLYALAFGAPSTVGMITPIGGLCFLAGWLALAWASLDLIRPRTD